MADRDYDTELRELRIQIDDMRAEAMSRDKEEERITVEARELGVEVGDDLRAALDTALKRAERESRRSERELADATDELRQRVKSVQEGPPPELGEDGGEQEW